MTSIIRLTIVLTTLLTARSITQADQRPPNVVIIFTDDQGYGDLSCYGNPTIHTPHLDRMASEGIKLTQFYVASPVCSPSRVALLTGCYPKRVGMHKHVIFPEYDYGLHTDEVTIADMLKSRGYATGCFGKWHLGHREGMMPTDQGFDVFFGVPYSNDMSQFHRHRETKYTYRLPLMAGKEIIEWEPDQRYLTKRCTEAAIAFIDAHHDEPFFVYVPHSMPHIPIYASEDFEGKSPRGLYGDVIEEIDWSVGAIRAALERHGLTDDTLVIFTTDNGPWLQYKAQGGSAGPLRAGKGTTWEGGQRVPCIMAWPGRIPAATVCREIATAMDLFPTIAAITGSSRGTDHVIDGHDIGPLMFGDENATSPTDHFVYYASNGTLAGVRRGPWKLLLHVGEPKRPALFHVERDISEKWNVADEHPEIVEELRALAEASDARITAESRPVLTVPERFWNPERP